MAITIFTVGACIDYGEYIIIYCGCEGYKELDLKAIAERFGRDITFPELK
ncbi:MAG: hypothetical protein ACRC67_00100 [Inquilinus sp.]